MDKTCTASLGMKPILKLHTIYLVTPIAILVLKPLVTEDVVDVFQFGHMKIKQNLNMKKSI